MGEPGTIKANAGATILDAAAGCVAYLWQTADTNEVGPFRAEWEVVFTTGEAETYPNDGNVDVTIVKDLA